MYEIGRIIDGVLQTPEGVTAPPREVHVHHHHHHHAQVPAPQPERTAIVTRANTVEQISATLADIVRTARPMTEDEQRQIYRVMLGSVNLISAMIQLDHDNEPALRRKT